MSLMSRPSTLTRTATRAVLLAVLAISFGPAALLSQQAPNANRFTYRDVFDLEWARDPQISPDGKRVVFGRTGYDIMKDVQRSALWIVNTDGGELRALMEPGRNAGSPRWSPDGTRLLYVSSVEGNSEIFVRWMDSGQEASLTKLADSPGAVSWSPDGKSIAFTMFVPTVQAPFVKGLPSPPDGADWGPPVKFIESLSYRADGSGYTRPGYRHIFVVPAEGGTPRQVTDGPYDHGGPGWAPDGKSIVFSANRRAGGEYEPQESEIYEVSLSNLSITQLTRRQGPDFSPAVSPDGKLIAYSGNDDHEQGYEITHLYVMNRDGSGSRTLAPNLDRDLAGAVWNREGTGLYVQYDDLGDTRLAYVPLSGSLKNVADRLGGLSIDRPYGGSSYSIANDGRFAFTLVGTDHPADVAVGSANAPVQRLTRLNDDLWANKQPATVEEIWYRSSYDQRRIQGWITKPADFDPRKKYPLILEIHGGPFANYGARFSADYQLYATNGYVVLSTNPRGSTSYGAEFGNLIHHDYPNHDYDDLITGVDSLIGRGYIHPDSLFVTGGSGGGVLTAWIIGHTTRFRAAVVAKPVINWESFVLTADALPFFARYWMGKMPWEDPEPYRRRSPLTYVGNVTTPTLMVTGEQDWRTPSSEAEQFYGALKIRKVPTAMLRIPDSAHNFAERGSNLITKAAYTIEWFDKYRKPAPLPVP
ncbi:MAG: S9 family peptidase [Gemmatimonadetes bacterium]|nr:S9 family peptidase [Gemmatimonadota bacterium]